ncbi:Superoxide dismutase [Cu-Zn] [Lamellibrachia satsuma]|nr:Superoxide dismutase [Cu-Zn] [Lamellibrachia satsuma]
MALVAAATTTATLCTAGTSEIWTSTESTGTNNTDTTTPSVEPTSKAADDMMHAVCYVRPETGSGAENISGIIRFNQQRGGNITITVALTGFNKTNNGAKHGFHVHTNGDLGDGCKAAGGHYNPLGKQHGGPDNTERHVGDLGNVIQDTNGNASVTILDHLVSLEGNYSVVGRAIVIHEGEDDLGKGNHSDSKTSGHAGARIGCCVIEAVCVNTASSLHSSLLVVAALICVCL